MDKALGKVQAQRLERLVRAKGDFEQVCVQSRGEHLLIQVMGADGTSEVIARATREVGRDYGLSFRTTNGRWEPMPVSGTLEAIAEGLTGLLGPYLDPRHR